jgi:Holliday junction resolvase RusA-like endonuclease
VNTREFFLRCVPPKSSHHAKKIVRVGKWTRLADKPELVAAKAMLDELLLPHQPEAPLDGPVCLSLAFTWPWLASDSKRTKAIGRVPHDHRPDCSNVAKTIEDRLVALRFLADDNQVVDLRVTKWRGEDAGISVTLAPCVPVARATLAQDATSLPSSQSGLPAALARPSREPRATTSPSIPSLEA